jgi:hypothetical protein
VLQAQHYRHEGRSIAEIARLLEQAPSTIKAYLYDPTGERARATKARLPRHLRIVRSRHLRRRRQGPRVAALPALQAAIHANVDARARSRGTPPPV